MGACAPFALAVALALAATAAMPAAQAQTSRAHVHGQLRLDVVIDGPTVTIALDAPLDTLVGFERAPRSEAEKAAVQSAIAQLRAADRLFKIDAAGNCKLGPVELQSAQLGLGKTESAASADGHADFKAGFGFNCSHAEQVRFIELGLFQAFEAARQIDVRIVTAEGQFRRTLRRPATRLTWAR